MRFAFFAALVIIVNAFECDPSKIEYEIYNDEQCAELNKEATEQYKHIQGSDHNKWKIGCHDFNTKFSYRLTCDGRGVHEQVFKGKSCMKPADTMKNKGTTTFQWNTCEKSPGANSYFVVRTKQVFQDKQGLLQ